MSLRFLIDTNVISEPVREQPRREIVRKLRRHAEEIAIATVVWHELQFGLERMPESRRRNRLARYLDNVVANLPMLDYDRAAAEWHAKERARLTAAGTPPPFADGQIAAIAHVHDLIVVTFNEADFRRFHGARALNWL